jgi:hypothetical protein
MNRYRFFITLPLMILAVLSGCSTSALVVKPSDSVANEQSYIATRFDGARMNIALVELTDRSKVVLDLKDTEELQIVPVPEGEYAIYRINGNSSLGRTILLGSEEYYMAIPIQLMRVIDVKPGQTVYIGEFSIRRTVNLNPTVGGTVSYVYLPNEARQEYLDLYGSDYRVPLVGFAR